MSVSAIIYKLPPEDLDKEQQKEQDLRESKMRTALSLIENGRDQTTYNLVTKMVSDIQQHINVLFTVLEPVNAENQQLDEEDYQDIVSALGGLDDVVRETLDAVEEIRPTFSESESEDCDDIVLSKSIGNLDVSE